MSKTPRKGPDYSREREWGVILEDLQAQFRTFGEGLASVREELGGFRLEVRKRFEHLEMDIAFIKVNYATKKDLEKALEKAVEPLATKKDLELLEKRLTTLETSR